MLRDSLEAVSHKGIKRMLSLKFVQTGEIDPIYAKIYQRLFDSRQAGDYEDFTYFDKDTFEELRPLAIKFINEVSRLV